MKPDHSLGAGQRGALLFREPFGAVPNNFLASAPGHPFFVRAAEMACEALLRRDNESTWSKTGPGLLTRVAAVQILEDAGRVAASVSILPIWRLRREVLIHGALPYKKTEAHWNGATIRIGKGASDALLRLASECENGAVRAGYYPNANVGAPASSSSPAFAQ
jgi:hypothetical protein